MFKYIILLVIGIAVGYQLGFRDAAAHKPHVMERVVSRAGGSHRENMKTDVDKEMRRLEQ